MKAENRNNSKGDLKMDCSKTIDFFVEKQRLCASRRDCSITDGRCLLYEFCNEVASSLSRKDIEYGIENLHKWSRENPRKTYAQDFFEKFPDAPKCKSFNNGGCPSACRTRIYGGKCPEIECAECWNEPMEE